MRRFLFSTCARPLCRAGDIGFLYALDQDAAAFRKAVGEPDAHIKTGSREITRYTISGRHVFLLKMRAGAVESAISAEALLGKFPCSVVFCLGPAGGLSDTIATGSWFRVAGVVAYQRGSWGSAGFQMAPGATYVLKDVPDKWTVPALLKNLPAVTVASGEVFVSSDSFREDLRDAQKAGAVDMNLFGVAAACADHNVPLYSWHIVSDRADANAAADFAKFIAKYDGAGGKAIAELIRTLPPDPNSPASYPALQKLLSK